MFDNADLHVTPAYGRDYKSIVEVKESWHGGKDFLLHGKPMSIRNVEPTTQVWVRYAKLRKMVRVQ
jgi:hypothetical protein